MTTIRANDDHGSGFDATFYAQDRQTKLLEVNGMQISSSDREPILRLTLRSDRVDFEHDSLYLLNAEFVGTTTWYGGEFVLAGVLTKFLYRTEDDVTAALKECPSGDGVYVPKGPLPEGGGSERGDIEAWQGRPYQMLRVSIRCRPRRQEQEGST